MNRDVVVAVLVSFGISAILCPVLIPFLRRLKFGQQVRDDGPQSHLKKAGTPTMGGLAFLISVTVTGLLFMNKYPRTIPLLFMTIGFGIIGFLDDYIKILLKRSEGLKAWQKLAMQILFTAVFAYYLVCRSGMGTAVAIPFTNYVWDMGPYLYVALVFFVVLGTDNGVNFTDGLDGLCSSVTVLVAMFFTIASASLGGGIETVTASVVGALLGFLLFNVYPASVFMGDTGSLSLGAFVASSALMLRQPFIILLVGFIYLIEVLSVIIQVGYFKKTKGKRIFRMAPIHHHFELGGWSETRVVAVFSIVTALLCLVALLAV